MSRVGLGRHGGLRSDAGDPLDGLVNLFDLGIVLAVAFLIAGLGLTRNADTGTIAPRAPVAPPGGQTRQLNAPDPATRARGSGQAVGTVYRLPDGRLVLVEPGGRRRGIAP